jgi:hypothetical protein
MEIQAPNNMNIRQAARWAEREDILVREGRDGQPDWLYAVYDTNTNRVTCIGYYEKCSQHMLDAGCKHASCAGHHETTDGRWLRMQSLHCIVQEMDESEGEAMFPERD